MSIAVYSILRPEDAAGGVDLLDRELHAVVEVRAGGRAGSGQLDETYDGHRLVLGEQRYRGAERQHGNEPAGRAFQRGSP